MIELFFIIPYFMGKAMQDQQRKQMEQKLIAEYLEKKKKMEEEAAKIAEEEESEYETEDEYDLMVDHEVHESGLVIDNDGHVIGHLVEGNAELLAGKKIKEDGIIQDENGNVIGRVEPAESSDDEDSDEEETKESGSEKGTLPSDSEKNNGLDEQTNLSQENDAPKVKEDVPNFLQSRAESMSDSIQQSLEKITPVLKTISWTVGCEERRPEKERDEEALVDHVKLLVEQAFNILKDTHSSIQRLNPDVDLSDEAKVNVFQREPSSEEERLAEVVSLLIAEVIKTMDRAKKKVKAMPDAKKEIATQCHTLQSSLLQALSAMSPLFTNILGMAAHRLNDMGLGSIVNNALGGIDLYKLLENFEKDNKAVP